MGYTRLLLWAAAPLAAWCANFTSLGEKTACRQYADESQDCDENSNPCNDRYDVLTEMNLEECKMLCGKLMKSCYGIEFFPSGTGGRCEIWKVEIGRAKSVSLNYECFKSEDQSSDAEDADLVMMFQVELGGVDVTFFAGLVSNATLLMELSETVKSAIEPVMNNEGNKWAFTMDDVKVMLVENSDPPLINVTIEPSAGILQLYAFLRGSDDFKDGTEEGGRDAVKLALKNGMEALPWITDLAPGGTVTPTLMNRMIMEPSSMGAPSPSPTPSSETSPAPSPSDTNVDGATRCWSTLALITSWVVWVQWREAQ